MIAHLTGVPVEELLLPLAYGGGALWVAVRAIARGSGTQAPEGLPV